MEVQPSLVLLQKTLLNVEGLGRQLYPDLDLWQTALPYLENWNKQRLNPLTLINRLQEKIPDWIDQLPQLPQLLINAATESQQLTEINASLRQQQERYQQQTELQNRRSRTIGIVLLAAAAISLIPGVNEGIQNLPIITLSLALLGAYLLYFRR